MDQYLGDPLRRSPDRAHPVAWYYGERLMGFLTEAALDERRRRLGRRRDEQSWYYTEPRR